MKVVLIDLIFPVNNILRTHDVRFDYFFYGDGLPREQSDHFSYISKYMVIH